MESYDFSEDEIREQLMKLGFQHVSDERLQLFKKDLAELVNQERSKSSGLFSNDSNISSSETELASSDQGSAVWHSARPTSDPDNSSSFDLIPSMHDPTITIKKSALNENMAKDGGMGTALERRQVKRKVCRKVDGNIQIFDESVTESETDDLCSLQQGIEAMALPARPRSAYTAKETNHPLLRPGSADPVYRLPENFLGLKALIRPMPKEPHKRHIHKSDPVSQYQKYKNTWSHHRAPGDKAHKGLRWDVRENMLSQDRVIKKKQPTVYVPNQYTIPSDKKRKNLRWQIRNDLAQGQVPPSAFE